MFSPTRDQCSKKQAVQQTSCHLPLMPPTFLLASPLILAMARQIVLHGPIGEAIGRMGYCVSWQHSLQIICCRCASTQSGGRMT